ncbi:MAG: M81 family metallopeptidase [Acidimicrobiia bacterium]|nr:M81 family metallopeptidase [Acidimicrobiia bacterium]
MKRVVTGGISHETSTFTTVPTTLQSYRERFLLRGPEILKVMRGTNTTLGGYIDGAEKHGFELIPTLLAEAHTSAPTPRAVFDGLVGELLDGIRAAGPIDGVLLELHGSMCAGDLDGSDAVPDAEGHVLAEIRRLVGPGVPILAELDIHSNVSPLMVQMADVLIGRETYPEVDMAERARECADVLSRIWKDRLRPTMALHQIPMVWGMNQVTNHSPMKEAMAELHRIEAQPGVVCASIATCYFVADVPDMGASVYVVTDNDLAAAQRYADELGAWCYQRRADWHFHMPRTRDALAQALAAGRYPVIFADLQDNTGGGSPGDSTGMLRTFVDAGLRDACVLNITDPDAVRQCQAAGVGGQLTLDVGGKSSPLQGQPVRMTARVLALSDGKFRYDGPIYAGLERSLGPSAHIEQNGIHVLLTTHREQPYDTAFARTLGLDPRQMRFIGVKSAAHFRAGFESWAGAIYVVSEPSVHDLRNLTFKRLKRQLYSFSDAK